MKNRNDKTKVTLVTLILVFTVMLVVVTSLLTVELISRQSLIKQARISGDKFLQDMMSGNSKDAYLLTSLTFKENTSYDSLAVLANQFNYGISGQPKYNGDWKISKSTRNTEIATATFTTYSADGSSGKISMTMQKINNKWFVAQLNYPSSVLSR